MRQSPTLSSHCSKHFRFPNHLRVAHACTSTFQNIIYYPVPDDVAKKERVGSQVDQVITYCVLLVFLLNLPRASIFTLFLFLCFCFSLVLFVFCGWLVGWSVGLVKWA